MSNASFAINEQDFDCFMQTCHPSINKYIKQATPGYKSRTVKNPSYYSGIHKQQFRLAQRYATAMCKQVEQAVEAAEEKILELTSRVKTLEARTPEHSTKEELTQKSSVLVQEWQAKLCGFVDFDKTDQTHRDFTEEWHYEQDKTLWFVNPETQEVMDASVTTRPIIGIRSGDIESGFTLLPAH